MPDTRAITRRTVLRRLRAYAQHRGLTVTIANGDYTLTAPDGNAVRIESHELGKWCRMHGVLTRREYSEECGDRVRHHVHLADLTDIYPPVPGDGQEPVRDVTGTHPDPFHTDAGVVEIDRDEGVVLIHLGGGDVLVLPWGMLEDVVNQLQEFSDAGEKAAEREAAEDATAELAAIVDAHA